MSENSPFVSVIIPVYHDWESLDRALNALNRQTWPEDRMEVIVINNDVSDPFPTRYKNRNNLRLACEKLTGSYAARNKGINISRGDLLGFCDADCIPCSNWIKNSVSFLQSNPGCFRIAGRIELLYGHNQNRTLAEMHESIFAFRQDWYAQNGGSTTANMFVWRHVFDVVGIFNEKLLSGGDLEWGQRALTAGFSISYCPSALVLHPARHTMHQLIKKAKRICSGYIEINNADIRKNPLNAFYHGFCMIKPPIKAGTMIFSQKGILLHHKILLYFLEYMLKLIQFREYLRCQSDYSHL